jgi:hypothetical protein
MREWSSGAQTDFTNYAAQRLAERGLLKEQDPIKLQQAVTDIARAYANGGNTPAAYVSMDNPLTLSAPTKALQWSSQSLEGELRAEQKTQRTEEQKARHSDEHLEPGTKVPDNLKSSVDAQISNLETTLQEGGREIDATSKALQENYNNQVRPEKISGNHGGNQAVWDTVSAQPANRADLNTER